MSQTSLLDACGIAGRISDRLKNSEGQGVIQALLCQELDFCEGHHILI